MQHFVLLTGFIIIILVMKYLNKRMTISSILITRNKPQFVM